MRHLRRALAAACTAVGFSASAGAEPPEPGTVFRDCAACPEMVVVPAGAFTMGEDGRYPYEGPARTVTIAQPFAIGRFEVTFDEWQACVDAEACAETPYDHDWGYGRRPVINVTIAQVERYLQWLTAASGHRYRLPSEAEWAYANRAGTTTAFWWGDTVGSNNANCRGCGSAWDGLRSAPVGSFAPNPFGLYDTTGNVLEWVRDCWSADLRGTPADGSAHTRDTCRERVIRGGNWYYVDKVARAAWRGKTDARIDSYGIGFRVARDLE